MTESEHRSVEHILGTLSPWMLSVLARKDNSAAIRKHARDALIKQIMERELGCSRASGS